MSSLFHITNTCRINGDPQQRGDDNGPEHGQEQVSMKIGDYNQGHVAPDHENLAMGHMDQAEKAEDEGVPERHKDVSTP
jgi:hypothetical protein